METRQLTEQNEFHPTEEMITRIISEIPKSFFIKYTSGILKNKIEFDDFRQDLWIQIKSNPNILNIALNFEHLKALILKEAQRLCIDKARGISAQKRGSLYEHITLPNQNSISEPKTPDTISYEESIILAEQLLKNAGAENLIPLFKLRFIEGLEYSEIKRKFTLSYTSVSRAVNKIKEILKPLNIKH